MPFRRLPLASVALLLAACSPAMDWREVRPETSGVVALFPCKPASHARRLTLAQAPVKLTLYACNAGAVTWALAYADMPDSARVGDALQALRTTAAANLGVAPEAPARLPFRLDGSTPNPESGRFELTGRLPDNQPVREQLAVFARGSTVFQASALGEKLDEESLDAFFNGLRLLP